MGVCRTMKTHFLRARPWRHKEGWAHLSLTFTYRASLARKQATQQRAMLLCRDCCAPQTAAPCTSPARAPMRSCHLLVIPAFNRAPAVTASVLFFGHHQCAQQSKNHRKRRGPPRPPQHSLAREQTELSHQTELRGS